jgi:hypothetical protein
MSISLSYHGTSFEVWHSQQTWFWLVVNRYRSGGSIGVARNQADAIREARSSIEEMSVCDNTPATGEKLTCGS